MINKLDLVSIISKYFLNGKNEAVKWDIKDNNALLPTIIKCDIEGAEYDFIESLSDEFFDTIRVFIVEYHYNDSNDKVWPLIKRFLNLGYTIRLVDKNVLEGNMGTFIAEKNWQL